MKQRGKPYRQMKNMGFEKEEIIDLIREEKGGASHEQ